MDFRLDRFDVDEYRQLDSPLNADLYEVVPGKIVMNRSAKTLGRIRASIILEFFNDFFAEPPPAPGT